MWKATPPNLEEIITEEPKGEGEESEKEEEEKPEEEPEKDEDSDNSDKSEKSKKEGEEEDEGEQGEGEEEEKAPSKPPTPPPKEYRNLPYTEADFEKRVPPKEFERIKEIEDIVLKFKKENLKTYVVAGGVLYGNGETDSVFNSRFKSAWLQKPSRLTYIGEGLNKVPSIHVRDLVSIVRKLWETKPEQQYVFGIDNASDRTQKCLIESISKGIGTGKVKSIEEHEDKVSKTDYSLNQPVREHTTLTLDLNLTPSPLMVA